MEWSDVGSVVLKYAPVVGEALISPAGAIMGIGTILANAFGVEDNPASVMDYIKKNPELAQQKLIAEMSNNLELQKLSVEIFKAEVSDRTNARQMQISTKDSIPGILAVTFTTFYFITFFFHYKLGIADSAMNGMSALEALILSFYFGGINKKT